MDDFRAYRMNKSEEWRSKAFAFGGPMGNVLSKSFDLIKTVMRDGVANERNLGYALESLQTETKLARERDMERDDALRDLVYGLTESMVSMLECVVEDNHLNTVTMPVMPLLLSTGGTNTTSEDSDILLPKEEEDTDLFDSTQMVAAIIEEEEKPQNSRSQSTIPYGDTSNLEESDSIVEEEQPCSSLDRAHAPSSPDSSERSESPPPPKKRSRATVDSDDYYDDRWESRTSKAKRRLRPRSQRMGTPNAIRNPKRGCTSGRKRYFDNDVEDEIEEEGDDVEVASVPGLYKCAQCTKTFFTTRGLKKHTYSHENIACAFCNKEVPKTGLAQHVIDAHPARMETRRSLNPRSNAERRD